MAMPDSAPLAEELRCLLVTRAESGEMRAEVARRPLSELPTGDVLIRVAYSSLNYKDALSATGHPGVTRKFPHVPGIDAAGTVVHSSEPGFVPGQQVLVTGYDLGQNRWGGFAEYVRVPAEWVLPLPAGLSLRESMIYGTAGLTAGLAVRALAHRGVGPGLGEVVVSGATGGVGSLAVAILAHLGYTVVASTGKQAEHAYLRELGAARVIGREELVDTTEKPLLAARWAGGVDTVGGRTLATLVRSLRRGGCVAACGLVGGAELALTVYPFLLRGVDLVGIDSAECPHAVRAEVWAALAGPWKPRCLERLAREARLEELPELVAAILRGEIRGRVLVVSQPG